MGFNTVAVLYNDFTQDIRDSGPLGKRIAAAMTEFDPCSEYHARHFGSGMVISSAHADYSQVVIVGQNSGCRAADARNLDWIALEQMKDCLERHGYRVTKPRKRPASVIENPPSTETAHDPR